MFLGLRYLALPCPFLYQEDGFLFLDALVTLLVHPVVFPFDVGEFLRHVPACEVKQEGRHGVVPARSLEVGYKEVPADDGLHPHGEVSDNPHLVLVRDIRLVFRNPHGCEVFLPERGQKEEVQHGIFVRTELAARDVGFENLSLGVLHRAFECDFLVALVLLLQFLHG